MGEINHCGLCGESVAGEETIRLRSGRLAHRRCQERMAQQTHATRVQTRRAREDAAAPASGRCENCGYPDDLCRRDGRLLCKACLLVGDGELQAENHHPLLRINGDETVRTEANLHEYFTRKQRDWPLSVQNNRERHAVLMIAGLLYSLADLGEYLARSARAFADALVRLHHALVERIGHDYWGQLGLGPLWA